MKHLLFLVVATTLTTSSHHRSDMVAYRSGFTAPVNSPCNRVAIVAKMSQFAGLVIGGPSPTRRTVANSERLSGA
jgi:hypothetical protein